MRTANRKTVMENTKCFTSAVDLQLGTRMTKAPIHCSRSTLCVPQETSSGEQLCNKINMCEETGEVFPANSARVLRRKEAWHQEESVFGAM